ncbi:TetR/AcrR family transcriptional regulator [Lapillicoccus sp.]|uniref:TetR/AcrR family transcriptional regulator n=1 Tax=Lapillicoccus sp. TaxID=1909287 RepID=UPI003264B7AB
MSSPDRALAHPRRRQRLDEAQRRKQIIAGCIQVVAEHGYQQASLALIAEVAGVSKGLIWHYYSDRDTLMEQAAVTTVAQLRNRVGADIDLTYYEETYQAQEQLFRRGQAEGSLREFDTRVMAVTYQGAVDAMLGYLESHTDTLSSLLIAPVADRSGASIGCRSAG